jgi:hypothetical protein
MPRVIVDGVAIHRPESDCEIADSTSLIEVLELAEREMKAVPEEICPECFPDLAE